jgi:hypothetical protein
MRRDGRTVTGEKGENRFAEITSIVADALLGSGINFSEDDGR